MLLATLCFAGGVDPVQHRIDSIEKGRFPPGSRVPFTASELQAWMRDEAKIYAPEGIRDLRLVLRDGVATGTALVDFAKLRQVRGGMFSGERPVELTVRIESKSGMARVDVQRLEISGYALQGVGLEFLMQAYLRASFPDARAGEWFALDRHVDHLRVSPAGVAVVVK